MSVFYEIKPLDTLFFRGNIPMIAGMQNVTSVFPPPNSVLEGAFWTASCQNNQNVTDESKRYGTPDMMPKLKGFYIKKGENYYISTPATWYYDYSGNEKIKKGKDLFNNKVHLLIAGDINEDLKKQLGIKTSADPVSFVVAKEDANSLSGCWLNVKALNKNNGQKFEAEDVLFKSEVYETEVRTGVGLDDNKKAEDGKLFSSTHIRLMEDISLVVEFENDFEYLGQCGEMYLGGEKRVVFYEKKNKPSVIPEHSHNEENRNYVSMIPIDSKGKDSEPMKALVSSGKITVTSGWDMARKFDKDTINWIPAGAVFKKNINGVCLPLAK